MVLIGTRQSTYDRLIANAAKSGYGVVTISEEGFLADPTPSSHIKFDESLLKSVRKINGIQEASPRATAAAVVYTAKSSTGAQLLGVDVRYESLSNNVMLSSLTSGARLQPGVNDDCLVGTTMAAQLGIKLGDRLIYTTTDAKGQMTSNVVHVGGIFQTGSPELDGHLVLMPLAVLQKSLGYDADEVSFIALFSDPALLTPKMVPAVAKKIAKSFATKAHVSFWRENFPEVAQTIDIDQTLYGLLLMFSAIIISTGILNAMMLNILERRRELGIMLATGMPPFGIVIMVAWEGFVLGVIGLLIGGIAALPLYRFLHDKGLDLSSFLGEQSDHTVVAIDQILGCRLSAGQFGAITGSLLLMSLVAGLYPAFKAASTEPIQVIRS